MKAITPHFLDMAILWLCLAIGFASILLDFGVLDGRF